jgi:hypothetical protein
MLVQGSLNELAFQKLAVCAFSSRGVPFEKRISVGMPKVSPSFRNAAVYLFPTVEDANEGRNFGGTGFLMGVPSERHAKYGRYHYYIVTSSAGVRLVLLSYKFHL